MTSAETKRRRKLKRRKGPHPSQIKPTPEPPGPFRVKDAFSILGGVVMAAAVLYIGLAAWSGAGWFVSVEHRELITGWPGGDFGYGLTAGFVTAYGVGMFIFYPHRPLWRKQEGERSLLRPSIRVLGGGVTAAVWLIAATSLVYLKPSKSHRRDSCFTASGEYCKVGDQHPAAFLLVILGLAAGAYAVFLTRRILRARQPQGGW